MERYGCPSSTEAVLTTTVNKGTAALAENPELGANSGFSERLDAASRHLLDVLDDKLKRNALLRDDAGFARVYDRAAAHAGRASLKL